MAENVLEVNKLVKNYGSFKAVKGISFVVPRGKVIGLLGPNGAGKTTTIQMLLGITENDSGTINYFGENFTANHQAGLQRINFTSAYNSLQGRITVWENLMVFAGLYSIRKPQAKIRELVEYFGITDLLGQTFWNLSAGQKTRVNLVKALLNDPELILMDEPTASLDPDIADKTLQLIEELRESRNLSILFTSHNMEEVARICDEVIFLDQGAIVKQDTPKNLTKQITEAELSLVLSAGREKLESYLKDHKLTYTFSSDRHVAIKTTEKAIPKLLFALNETGAEIADIEIQKPKLEDVFLQIARGNDE